MLVRDVARRLARGQGESPTAGPDQGRLSELLAPARCALLVVDVQNDFVHPRGRIGPGRARAGYAAALAAINGLIGAARTAGVSVIYVRTEHGPGLDSASYRAIRARRAHAPDGPCLMGTWGAEFAAELIAPRDGEQVVTKHGYDAFAVPGLAEGLAAAGREAVVVTGVATTLCVAATVAGAFEHGLYPILPREATAASDAGQARAALRRVHIHYGDVVPVKLVRDAWRSAAGPAD